MKKLTRSLMLAALLILLWGCSNPEPPVPPTQAVPAPTAAPTITPTAVPTVPPTEAPTAPPTEAPTPPTEPPTEPEVTALQYEDMKAMWLSQFDLAGIYQENGAQRPEADFTARMAQVLDNLADQGFNTVFLQVRPNGDSMYPSRYCPASAYVAGQVGGSLTYDPVAIIIRLAHQRQLSIHGWINPMRAMAESEICNVDTAYAIRRWYDDPATCGRYVVPVKGTLYLNPAYPEVRELILAGAEELLLLYDFDGLHMDDYFYPTTDASFDADAYAAYRAEGGQLELADFRRESLNRLVGQLYRLTHDSRPGRVFGISPAGNVDTVYNSQFADIYEWCRMDGYIDYICPQVYFGLEHGSHDFVKVCRTYQDMITADSVELVVGMTFGKAFTQEDAWAGTGKHEWKDHRDVLARCLHTTRELQHCRGVAVFCYQYFFDPLTGEPIPETAAERENFIPVFREITW